jgi:hypothetical protein
MRAILLAMLVAAGTGLAGTPGAHAAPANGAAIIDAADATSLAEQTQYWHGRRRSHWRWGSGGGWRGGRIVCRHHYWSSGRRCWRRW